MNKNGVRSHYRQEWSRNLFIPLIPLIPRGDGYERTKAVAIRHRKKFQQQSLPISERSLPTSVVAPPLARRNDVDLFSIYRGYNLFAGTIATLSLTRFVSFNGP